MDNESISGDPQNSTPSNGGVSRRSLMKAGAHAAWAIPMVQVVAAAPAIAASGAVLDVTAVTGNFTGTGNGSNEIRTTHMSFSVSTDRWSPTAAVAATIAFTGGITAITAHPSDWQPSQSNPLSFTKSYTGGSAKDLWRESDLQFTGTRAGSTNTPITGSVSVNAADSVAGPKTDSSTFSLSR